jgi:CHAT domain-containing protein
MESAKSRFLLDQLQTEFGGFSSPQTAARVAEMERSMLRFNRNSSQDIMDEEMWLVSRLPIGNDWDGAVSQRQALAEIEKLYAAEQAGFAESAAVATLADIQKALKQDEVLVEYYIPYHPLHPSAEIGILVITSTGARFQRVQLQDQSGMIGRVIIDGKEPVDRSGLVGNVVVLRNAIRTRQDSEANEILKKLYEVLIAPIQNEALSSYRHWIIVPHGVLHYIPFAALIGPQGRRLIEDVQVSLVPSASAWLHLRRKPYHAIERFLGLANPELNGSPLPPLPNAEKGLEDICKILEKLQCTARVRATATLAELRADLPGKDVVHFATHGEFPEEDVLDFHRLLLAPTAQEDGRLLAEELCRLDFRSARLVVLCICNGGLFRCGPGDEPYGLVPAFLRAGAENVLATLWPWRTKPHTISSSNSISA